MTITNQTLMWLAPLAGTAAMTLTTLVTHRLDMHRRQPSATAVSGQQGVAVNPAPIGAGRDMSEDDMRKVMAEIAARITSPRP